MTYRLCECLSTETWIEFTRPVSSNILSLFCQPRVCHTFSHTWHSSYHSIDAYGVLNVYNPQVTLYIVWTKFKENNQHIVKNTVRMPKVLFSRKHDINIIRMNSGTYRPWHHHSIRSQYSGFRNTWRQWTVSTLYHVIRHDNGGMIIAKGLLMLRLELFHPPLPII